MIHVVLLWTGAILIAFELVARSPHPLSFLLLPFYHPIHALVQKPSLSGKPLMVGYLVLMGWLVARLLLLAVIAVMSPVAVALMALWVAGQFLQYINHEVNAGYQRGLTRFYPQLLKLSRSLRGTSFPSMTDAERSEILRQTRIPFVAIVGLALLISGFVLLWLGL